MMVDFHLILMGKHSKTIKAQLTLSVPTSQMLLITSLYIIQWLWILHLIAFIKYLLDRFHIQILTPVSTREISEIIKSLKWNNSHGYDEIPTKILKISFPFIISPLTYTVLTLQSNFSTYWTEVSEVEETLHGQQPTAALLKFTGLWYRKFYVHNY